MKVFKKTLFLLTMFLGVMTLMSTTCNTENDDPVNPECNGYMQMSTNGFMSNSFCFDNFPQYTYDTENQRVTFSANVTIDGVTYSGDIAIVPFTGSKSYVCDKDNPGFVELIIHGDDNEFYQSQSGTINVTQADADHFVATFNVSAKGYNNGETVTIQGSVLKVK